MGVAQLLHSIKADAALVVQCWVLDVLGCCGISYQCKHDNVQDSVQCHTSCS